MDANKFVVAESRWLQFNGMGKYDFRKFINQSTVLHGHNFNIWLTPSAAKKIEMLSGPHWLAILKIWKARDE